MNTSRELSVRMSPFVFNSLHVPLVHNSNNFLAFAFIYLLKEILVSLVDAYALQFWEEYFTILNEPVDLIGIKALLSELRWF